MLIARRRLLPNEPLGPFRDFRIVVPRLAGVAGDDLLGDGAVEDAIGPLAARHAGRERDEALAGDGAEPAELVQPLGVVVDADVEPGEDVGSGGGALTRPGSVDRAGR